MHPGFVVVYQMTRCCSILLSQCTIGLGLSSSERKRLSHVLTSMHVAISDEQIGKSYMDNWTFKNFIERYTVAHLYELHLVFLLFLRQTMCFLPYPLSYAHELSMLQQRNAKQCQELSESLDCIEAAESKSDSLVKCLEQELTVLEEKKYVSPLESTVCG